MITLDVIRVKTTASSCQKLADFRVVITLNVICKQKKPVHSQRNYLYSFKLLISLVTENRCSNHELPLMFEWVDGKDVGWNVGGTETKRFLHFLKSSNMS